ncbi:hypothetical protein D3C74_418700 [compost metagenome]
MDRPYHNVACLGVLCFQQRVADGAEFRRAGCSVYSRFACNDLLLYLLPGLREGILADQPVLEQLVSVDQRLTKSRVCEHGGQPAAVRDRHHALRAVLVRPVLRKGR